MSDRIVKLFDYVFVLRPTLFFPVWTVYAAGYFAAQHFSLAGKNGAAATHDGTALHVMGFLSLLMGGVFILNQLCDVATDLRNHKLFLIAHRHISPRAAWFEMMLLSGMAVAAAFFYRVELGGLFVAIFLLTGMLYSVSPFQWKDRPLWGLLANAAGALLIFIAGWWSVQIEWQLPIRHALPYILAVAAVYLYTTLLDVDGDASTQKMTFGVRYGLRATAITGCLLELGALISAWWLEDPVILYPALAAAPFFCWAAIKQRLADVSRAIKFPILFLALAICVKVWPYFFLLLLVFSFSRWYYRRRFGLKYPSLAAE
ncbi:MAG: UbiA family prenyltransferase [candidate division KSB1 bacterium]|nr:UbiA family prenyltransferase [candidate division KSB1 bacterium]